MTIGIYCLHFEGIDKVYIGKSNNIERRYTDHLRAFTKGKGSTKVQNAYNKYGSPKLNILCECNIEELDTLEVEAIELYNSYLDGYNSTKGGESGGYGLPGPKNGNAKYSREQIINCFNLLTNTDMLFKDIYKSTGVDICSLSEIASGKRHIWLSKEYPEEYLLMRSKCGNRNSITHSAKARGIIYPTLLSPTGAEFNIDNVTKFAKEHNLDPSNLLKVLKGKASIVKGWKLK